MENVESIKLNLITQIASLNDAQTLTQLELILNKSKANKDDVVSKLNRPRKKRIDIEMLKKEQKFSTFNRKRFDELIKELDIQEPIEQLLQMI